MKLRVFHVVAAVMFAAFATLQFNDDDTLIWVSIYTIAMIFHVFSAISGTAVMPQVRWPVLILFAGFAVFKLVQGIEAPAEPWFENENLNEAGGLFIAAASLLFGRKSQNF